METIIYVLHIFSCIFLVSLILIQRGQGADIGAAFGGASQTVFGSRGPATFLNKLTIVVAIIFLGASVFLAQTARHKTATSVVDEAKKLETPAAEEAAPAAAEEEKGVIEPEAAPAEEAPAEGEEKTE